jgi:hypothetical protein
MVRLTNLVCGDVALWHQTQALQQLLLCAPHLDSNQSRMVVVVMVTRRPLALHAA